MSTNIEQENWNSLKKIVLTVLENIESFLNDSLNIVPLDRSGINNDTLRRVRAEVQEFELRIAIIATTKAGKSTVVNALLGQELLPSRDASITVIPTEIVHSSKNAVPVLTIHQETIKSFQQTWKALHRTLKKRGKEEINEKTSRYPVKELVQKILSKPEVEIEPEITDPKEIRRVLFMLNDICRLSMIFDPALSPFHHETKLKLPRITAPFHSAKHEALHSGRLVIVDCPGPNEAAIDEFLYDIVSNQLKQASMILHVFNYLELTSGSVDILRERFHTLLELVPEDAVINLVNKIDERNKDDARDPEQAAKSLSPKQVQHFIITHMGLKQASSQKRIFEISARDAFIATRFLSDFDHLGPQPTVESVKELRSTDALASIVLGRYWDEDLSADQLPKLKIRAENLLLKSGFPQFFSQVIAILLRTVAPRILSEALIACQRPLGNQLARLQLRLSSLDADEVKLENEISQLNREIETVARESQSFASDLLEVSSAMKMEMESAAKQIKRYANIDIKSVWQKRTQGDLPLLKRFQKLPKQVIDALLDYNGQVAPRLRFETKEEAEAFVQGAVRYALEQAEPHISKLLRNTKTTIDAKSAQFEEKVAKVIQPIITRARIRMEKEFDISLELPPCNFGSPLSDSMAIKSNTQYSYNFKHGWRYERIWFTFWIKKKLVKYIESVDIYYDIKFEDITDETSRIIEQNIDRIQADFDDFIFSTFRKRVQDYLAELSSYLQDYKYIMADVSRQKRLSLEKRKAMKGELVTLRERLHAQVHQARQLQQRIRMLNDREFERACQRVCIIYADDDRRIVEDLEIHFSQLKHQGVIEVWHEAKLMPGDDRDAELASHIEKAHLVLVVLSAAFLASRLYRTLLPQILERHGLGLLRVVPIIGRPCDWRQGQLGHLQALPKDGKSITEARQRDVMLSQLVEEIRRVIGADDI